jgi:hypothetical protein
MITEYSEQVSEYESNINLFYINFKTTIDYYDKENLIDKNGNRFNV